MAVSKKMRALYMNFFDGIETSCANLISNVQETRSRKKRMPEDSVPQSLRKEVAAYWKQFGVKVSPEWAWYYGARNGIVDPRYIPNTLAYARMDQHFNDRKLGYGFNDKNYYARIFGGDIRQPGTVVRKIKGFLLDEEYQQITLDEAVRRISGEREVICKPSLESGSGRSIAFWNTERDAQKIRDFLADDREADYIVQQLIIQHDEMKRVHESSINSVRIMSLLMKDGVHIISSVLRMGVGGSRLDNLSAGGIVCGIREGGRLDKYAYENYRGARAEVHPQGFVYEGFCVPGYDKAVDLVRRAHPMIPHFRLVSWDIAIDAQGEPVLIEANMRKGGVAVHQFPNGPLFGDMTDQVLREVFSK